MPSIWNPINPKQKRPRSTGYEGNAEQLLDYAVAHPSPRALRAFRVEAEVKRARKEGALPPVAEIQARHNFTEEAAQSFIRSMKRAMRRNDPPGSSFRKSKPIPSQAPDFVPILGNAPLTFPALDAPKTTLQAILQDIRTRHFDEIRIHGEQTSVREGFIYLVTHPCFDGWVKAGMTIDYELRIGTYNVADPLSRFELSAVKWVIDRRESEMELLQRLNKSSQEMRGEWARIELAVALSVLESL